LDRIVKKPVPESPALVCPHKEPWLWAIGALEYGVMEFWSIGISILAKCISLLDISS